jgi:hypothetical protein
MFLASVTAAGCDVGAKAVPPASDTTPAAGHHLAADTPKPSTAVTAAADAVVATAPVPAPMPAREEAPSQVVPVAAHAVETPATPEAEAVRYREITIPAGTTLSVALTSRVSSNGSSVEDAVNGTLRHPLMANGVTVAPMGSAVSGYVTEALRSGRVKGRARIGLRFTSLKAPDARYTIRTATVARQARATKKADAVKIGVGAGAGAIVGAIAGGKKGAAIGTAVGGGGGTGVVLATRGEEVALGSGSIVTTRLTAPLTVRVRVQ